MLSAIFRSPWVANMRFLEPRLPLVLACGLLAGLLVQTAAAGTDAAPAAHPPAYYLGGGFRGGKGDATAAVIDSKIRLVGVRDRSVSMRPALLMGGYDTEWRLPITIEGHQNARGISWFGGAGLAYNMDDLGETDAMVTGGVDYARSRHLVLNLTLNYIWQDKISDDDTEFMASVNYAF
jgi:hypothetical protein